MSLFQKSVENTYLSELNQTLVDSKFQEFCSFFHNSEIQENIRFSKEEQFQEGFFRELFGKIMGYTLNPEPNFNLTTELKNIANNRKADGAILKSGKAIAVIELKSSSTVDLDSAEQQAFGYKNHHQECRYVMTSNFIKLRFYIQNAVEFLEFDLFNLTRDQFAMLWLCLSKDSLMMDIPIRMKEFSVSKEESVTKKLYADYAEFRQELFASMQKLNPSVDKLLLFRKTQKLLDRFLFILFAEDRLLLPPNSINDILNQWKELREKYDAYFPLYDRFKKYFGYLNSGHKGVQYDIFAFNGGLFAPDDTLDNLIVDDDLLYKHSMVLCKYDFDTEVDVNILGHIFEHSLNEIEQIQAEIKGEFHDSRKSKRKKDGIFYTPKCVTKYIVDQTIGKLCGHKLQELKIEGSDYHSQHRKDAKKRLLDKLDTYRDWLKQLKILDPACGSGAFLNQALDFLINEHHKIDEWKTALLGGAIVLSDVENEILEKNIYGVDLNEESVEIAKLSLWLRTAKKGRKLNALSNNIKCGNSLIDDPEVAGYKTFNWFIEFPSVFPHYKKPRVTHIEEPEPGDRDFLDEVQEPSFSYKADSKGFQKHGFDVILGNPPYIPSTSMEVKTKKYFYDHYETAQYQINTFSLFVEKSIRLLKNNSFFGLIIPNYWISTKHDSNLRNLVFNKNHAISILNTYQIFEDATVDTLILIGKKTSIPEFPKITEVKSIGSNLRNISERLTALSEGTWDYQHFHEITGLEQDVSISFKTHFHLEGDRVLGDFVNCYQGMKPYEKGKGMPPQTRKMMDSRVYHSDRQSDAGFLPLIGSANVNRYFLKEPVGFIRYGNNLAAPRKLEIFKGPRLLVNRIFSNDRLDVAYTDETIINNTDVFNLIPKEGEAAKLLCFLALLASKTCYNFFRSTNVNLDRQAFPKINVNNLESFPIPINFPPESQAWLGDQAMIMMKETKALRDYQKNFADFIRTKFDMKLGNQLNTWYDLEFNGFLKALRKSGLKMSLSEEAEWMTFFNSEKQKVKCIQDNIKSIDDEIDRKVEDLYH